MKVIKVSDRRMGDYWGMNYYASKELHSSLRPRPNEIYVSDKLHGRKLRQVEAHEKIEAYQMKERGFKYKKADKIAEAFDKKVK